MITPKPQNPKTPKPREICDVVESYVDSLISMSHHVDLDLAKHCRQFAESVPVSRLVRAPCLAEYINVASEELLVLPPRVDSVPHPDSILSVVIK